ncbi:MULTISPECIES: YtxH domain-containing protein [Polyangium]|uniref:YtxH domain-containing protein n=2 Tax=Polyangium TaxID=55 RepID=A0A4U1JBX1_9BACT|nr:MULTISPECIES: YtxH domain-containing protein [Polyangium]MDI1432027.1 YtxH domain-containing protein [Polyangium sorediatum]TKD05125.1 YtxH domain-containing protein [Polyangium fumosum]
MKNYGFLQRLAESFPYERRTTTSWLVPASIGVGVGVALGVGIGLLYAPRTGEETRERLRQGADRVKDRARFTAGRVRGELESAANQIRERSFATSNEAGQSR